MAADLDRFLVGVFWAFYKHEVETDEQHTTGRRVGLLEDVIAVDPDRARRADLYGLAIGAVRGGVTFEFTECGRCGQPIGHRVEEGRWLHLDGSRGCRAATYEPGVGWDDTVARAWIAKPR